MNMFFHIKGLRILAMRLSVQAFMIKIILQKINLFLSQPSQVIFTPCDNIENNSNNDYKSKDQTILSQSS